MELVGDLGEKNALFGEIPCAAAVFVYDGNYARLTWANDRYFALLGASKKEYLDMEPSAYGFRLIGREYASTLLGKVDALSNNCNVF